MSLTAPNQARPLTKAMRASACVQYVCLAVNNYPFNRLVKAQHAISALLRIDSAGLPCTNPACYSAFDALTNIQNP